jgi:hypothetical protein
LADVAPAAQVVEHDRAVLGHVHRVQLFEGARPLLAIALERVLFGLVVARELGGIAQGDGGAVARILEQDKATWSRIWSEPRLERLLGKGKPAEPKR